MRPEKSRSTNALLAILFAGLATLAFAVAPVFAKETHVLAGSFGSSGPGAGQLALATHSGIALNQETGDLYIADTGNRRVDQFDPSKPQGEQFVRAFGADVGGPGLDLCSSSCVAGTATSSPGGFQAPIFIAVDNSIGGEGAVYVADTTSNTVSKFSSAGSLVSTWGNGGAAEAPDGQLVGRTGAQPFTEIAGIAVDSAGTLDVFEREPELLFEFDRVGTFEEEFSTPRGSTAAGLAVDSAGDFFKVNGEPDVEKFGPTGTEIGQVSKFRGLAAQAVALDPTNGDLYVDEAGTQIGRYAFNGSGEVIQPGGSTCAPGAPGIGCDPIDTFASSRLEAGAGLVVASDHGVYVADWGAQRVDHYLPVTLPDVVTGAATEVAQTTTDLEGTVDPARFAVTGCVFEYGFEESYGEEAPCEESPVQIGSGGSPVAVHAELSGLSAGRFYHYRLRASNSSGSEFGADRTFTTSPVPTSPVSCPTKELLRAENDSLLLPDCRAYELVSSADDAAVYQRRYSFILGNVAGGITASGQPMQAAPGGGAVTYAGEPPNAATGEGTGHSGADEGDQYLATREETGWTSVDAMPLGSRSTTFYEAISDDLSIGTISSGERLTPQVEADCEGKENLLYSRTLPSGSYGPYFSAGECGTSAFIDFSADDAHSVFESTALKPEALPEEAKRAKALGEGRNIYDSAGGQLYLVNILPGTKPKADPNATVGALADEPGPQGTAQVILPPVNADNVVSFDGSRIFWTDLNSGNVYVRENDTAEPSVIESGSCVEPSKACTVQVSAGPATYQTATPDGRYAYYSEAGRLWRFDTDAQTQPREPLTPASAGVLGVIGINQTGEDGAYLYFVAEAALAPGAEARTCTAAKGEGGTAQEAREGEEEVEGEAPPGRGCNLYLLHGGTTSYIASLLPRDNQLAKTASNSPTGDWRAILGNRTAQVSADGKAVVFTSEGRLTDYDNVETPSTAESTGCGTVGARHACAEIYLYSVPEGLSCVSCDPTGAPPSAPNVQGDQTFLPVNWFGLTHTERYISSTGDRVFFDTNQRLVAADTNGVQDVYEWERAGTGTCQRPSPVNGGCVLLLSSGTPGDYATFIDASASGEDVFFTTRASLVPGDLGTTPDLYDARVGGGFPVEVASRPCPNADGCRSSASVPPSITSPATSAFQADERSQRTACRKGSVRKHGKCVRHPKHRHKHKRAHRRHGGHK